MKTSEVVAQMEARAAAHDVRVAELQERGTVLVQQKREAEAERDVAKLELAAFRKLVADVIRGGADYDLARALRNAVEDD